MPRDRTPSMVGVLLLLAASVLAGTGLTIAFGHLSGEASEVATAVVEVRPGRAGPRGGLRPLRAAILGVDSTRITSGAWLDDDRLLVAGRGRRLFIFDATGRRMAEPAGPGNVRRVRTDPRGRGWLVAGSEVELRGRDGERLRTWAGHTAGVFDFAVADDGERLATASWDGSVRTWHGDGRPVSVIGGFGRTTRVALIAGGSRIVTADGGNTARIWSFAGDALGSAAARQGQVRDLLPAPAGNGFVLLDAGPVARLIDVDGGTLADLEGRSAAWCAAWNRDGSRIAVGRADGTVSLYAADGTPMLELHGHAAAVSALAYLPDGALVSAGGDRTLRLWDSEGGELAVVEAIPGPGWRAPWIHELQASPDGRHLLLIFKSEGHHAPWLLHLADLRGE